MKRIAMVLLLSAWAPAGWSAGGDLGLLDANVNLEDSASLQRGAGLYVNYCLGCHSLSFMRYDRMGRDLGLTDGQVSENLLFAADKVTAPMSIAMRPEAARNWFGVAPPDLSVISRARGPDWLYTYLTTFYADSNPSRPFGVNNVVFETSACRTPSFRCRAGRSTSGERCRRMRGKCTRSPSPSTATTSSFARARRCRTGVTCRSWTG